MCVCGKPKIKIFDVPFMLTESGGSISFFIPKSGVHYSVWPFFKFAHSMPAKRKRIVLTKGPMDDSAFSIFFSYTRVPSFMPHIRFWCPP